MINWGVVGLGRMGNEFINSIKETDNSQLVLVSSLDKRKLEIFSKNNNFTDKYQPNFICYGSFLLKANRCRIRKVSSF